MSLLVVGTVAFDAIETPFGKTDKIVGGAASYISLAASYFYKNIHLVSVIGDDFPTRFFKYFLKKMVQTLMDFKLKREKNRFFGRENITMI